MSTKHPVPGPDLKIVADLFDEYVDTLEGDKKSPPNVEAATVVLEKILAQLGPLSPDLVKLLHDKFINAAENFQGVADSLLLRMALFEEAAHKITGKYAEIMVATDCESMVGETWRATLIDGPPGMDFDRKVLLENGAKFMVQIPMLDEKKLMEALAAGEEIPGIKITPKKTLQFVLQKKQA